MAVHMAERARVHPSFSFPPLGLPPSLPVQLGADLRVQADALPTSLPPLDAFLGGLPLRRTHLLVGGRGSGVITL